jgi:hypothetical protein
LIRTLIKNFGQQLRTIIYINNNYFYYYFEWPAEDKVTLEKVGVDGVVIVVRGGSAIAIADSVEDLSSGSVEVSDAPYT